MGSFKSIWEGGQGARAIKIYKFLPFFLKICLKVLFLAEGGLLQPPLREFILKGLKVILVI